MDYPRVGKQRSAKKGKRKKGKEGKEEVAVEKLFRHEQEHRDIPVEGSRITFNLEPFQSVCNKFCAKPQNWSVNKGFSRVSIRFSNFFLSNETIETENSSLPRHFRIS